MFGGVGSQVLVIDTSWAPGCSLLPCLAHGRGTGMKLAEASHAWWTQEPQDLLCSSPSPSTCGTSDRGWGTRCSGEWRMVVGPLTEQMLPNWESLSHLGSRHTQKHSEMPPGTQLHAEVTRKVSCPKGSSGISDLANQGLKELVQQNHLQKNSEKKGFIFLICVLAPSPLLINQHIPPSHSQTWWK